MGLARRGREFKQKEAKKNEGNKQIKPTIKTNMKTQLFLSLLIAVLHSTSSTWATAQTFTILHSFTAYPSYTNTDGANPNGFVLSGNVLYGTAANGGSSQAGTVFKVNTDGTGFTTLHSFTGGHDGASPQAGLILSGNTLFGTAREGGSAGFGTVFAVNTDGLGFATLHSFSAVDYSSYPNTNSDGFGPTAGLSLLGNTLYGTAQYGGSSGLGTVFAVNTDGTGFTNLHSFSGSDGINPDAGLIVLGNTLYGTTIGGGGSGNGTVFAVRTDGTGFKNLHGFTAVDSSSYPSTNSDGAYPHAGLIVSGNTLFGTAAGGGSLGDGTVFAVHTDGSGFKNLHSFSGGSGGGVPYAVLALTNNILYGTTAAGGNSASGTLFALYTDGTGFTNLHNFSGGSDLLYPHAGLVLSGNTLFGAARYDGSSGEGAAFSVHTDGTGFTNLHSFSATSIPSTNRDGATPYAGLITNSSGKMLFGTSGAGGSSGKGTVFAVHIDGTGFTNLHNFIGSDGGSPGAELLLSGNTLYGTALYGGSSGNGTVFAVNTDGTGFTNLHDFTYSDGSYPHGGLILSGNILYGTAIQGGVFALHTDGTGFTNLHSFTGGSDGGLPYGGLVLTNNTLYGTASQGGSGAGIVFSVHTDGTGFTNLHSFNHDSDGAVPYSRLSLSGNTLYGAATYGGGGGPRHGVRRPHRRHGLYHFA